MISIETEIAGLKQLKIHAPLIYSMKIREMIREFKLLDEHRGVLMRPALTKKIERLKTVLTYS